MITKSIVERFGKITKKHCDTFQLNEAALFEPWGAFIRVKNDEFQVCEKHYYNNMRDPPEHYGESVMDSIDREEVIDKEPNEINLTTEELVTGQYPKNKYKKLYYVDKTNRNEVREINTEHVSREEIEALNEPVHELILVTVIGNRDDIQKMCFEVVK